MGNGTCIVCFRENTNVSNIKNTYCQHLYEALLDYQIQTDSYQLCYICHKRLLQCGQLVKQIEECKAREYQTERRHLVELSVASNILVTPARPIKLKRYIKVECNDDDEPIEAKAPVKANNAAAKPSQAKPTDKANNSAAKPSQAKPTDKAKPNSRPKTFKCDSCEKAFSQSSHLHRHHNTHTGVKYSCDVCTKSYTQRDTLVRHRQTHTPPDITFFCDICHTAFKRKEYLQGHMRIHTGDRFQCKECGRLFNLRRLLRIHQRIHAGNKPFCCAECGKRFNESGHLKKHMLTHVAEEFKCDLCPRSFKRLLGLKTHRRSHDRSK